MKNMTIILSYYDYYYYYELKPTLLINISHFDSASHVIGRSGVCGHVPPLFPCHQVTWCPLWCNIDCYRFYYDNIIIQYIKNI